MAKPRQGALKTIENRMEAGIFGSRWLLAPSYLGLIVSLLLLMFSFMKELIEFIPLLPTAKSGTVITTVLALVDNVMVANLVLLIIFAGYENFISKIDTNDHEDRPDWMGFVTFSDLKIKLMGTIVAISGIDLLKTFINVDHHTDAEIGWRLMLHLSFVVSGVLFALMDRLAAHSHSNHGRSHDGGDSSGAKPSTGGAAPKASPSPRGR
jgi:uncharacterized protein (TIGR00645 family)